MQESSPVLFSFTLLALLLLLIQSHVRNQNNNMKKLSYRRRLKFQSRYDGKLDRKSSAAFGA